MTEDDKNLWERIIASVSRDGRRSKYEVPMLTRMIARRHPNQIDLHGLTLQRAHRDLLIFLREASRHHREVIVVTGRSGSIKQEFPHWIEGRVRSYRELPNRGSFVVKLTKP